jgi:dihydroorotate dehydrogenase (fumarate)
MTGNDAIKMILAGANAFQIVSTLYKNGINHITDMLAQIESWMNKKGYKSLDDFRGKLAKKIFMTPLHTPCPVCGHPAPFK